MNPASKSGLMDRASRPRTCWPLDRATKQFGTSDTDRFGSHTHFVLDPRHRDASRAARHVSPLTFSSSSPPPAPPPHALHSALRLPRHRSGLESRSPASWRSVMARWRAGAAAWPPARQACEAGIWRRALGAAAPGQGVGMAGHESPVRAAAHKPSAQLPWRGRPPTQVPATSELARQRAPGAAGAPSAAAGSRRCGIQTRRRLPARWP